MGSKVQHRRRNKRNFKKLFINYLITEGCGFICSNLAAEVLKTGKELVVFDNLLSFGSSINLEKIKSQNCLK